MKKAKSGILEDKMKKQMRKNLLFVFLALFICTPLSALTALPAMSAQFGYSFPFAKDLRMSSPAEDFIVAADFGDLEVDSGLQYQAEQLDITSRVFFMPTFFNAFQAGFGFNYHFYRYIKTFTENDLVLTTRFRWIKGPVFSCEVAPGLLFKFATIDAVKKYTPVIYNFSYHFELLCRWQIFQPAAVWCALNLQDYFDYPLAISPVIKVGTEYAARPDLIFGIDYSMKFIDMFYSAVYLNESALRLTLKVAL